MWDWLALSAKSFFYQPKIWLAHYAETFFYRTKIWRMNYNQNCKSNNFVKTSQSWLLQINPAIYQHCNHMDPDMSIKYGDWSRSEEKRPKIWKVGIGERRRGAMLSVQSKAIDLRFVFSWFPPDVLTGWPFLPKPSFIKQRFGWLIISKLSFIRQRFGGWTTTTTASTTTFSNWSNHNFFKSIQL